MAAPRRVKLWGEESPDSIEQGVGPQGPSRKAWCPETERLKEQIRN